MTVDPTVARAALLAEQRATEALRRELLAEVAGIVDAASDVATDDEHDPEGATIAYERARSSALVGQVEERLAEIRRALTRLESGTYGRCERCGAQIPAARLEARPAVRTCIACASSPGPGR